DSFMIGSNPARRLTSKDTGQRPSRQTRSQKTEDDDKGQREGRCDRTQERRLIARKTTTSKVEQCHMPTDCDRLSLRHSSSSIRNRRGHFCHSEPMETHAFGFRPDQRPGGPKAISSGAVMTASTSPIAPPSPSHPTGGEVRRSE